MAIYRGTELAALKEKIPPQFKPGNNPKNLRDDFRVSHGDPDVTHAEDLLNQQHQTDQNLSAQLIMDAEGGSVLANGRIANAAAQTAGAMASGSGSEKEKKKAQGNLYFLLQQLDQINEQIELINDEIKELRAEIANAEADLEDRYGSDWREKTARGEMDDDPQIQAWKDKNRELLEKLQRLAELEGQKAEVEARLVSLDVDTGEFTLDEGQNNDDAKALSRSGMAIWREEHSLREGVPISQEKIKQEQDMEAEFMDDSSSSPLSEENELATFVQEHARIAQEITDPLMQSEALQELKDGLSQQARDNLSITSPEIFQDVSADEPKDTASSSDQNQHQPSSFTVPSSGIS